MLRKYLLIQLLILCGVMAYAQENNLRCKWVSTFDQKFELDTLSIAPHSFIVVSPNQGQIKIDYDLNSGQVKVLGARQADSIKLCYRVLPTTFSEIKQNRSLSQYDSNAVFKQLPIVLKAASEKDELFASDNLSKYGSISRTVSFGSNQDVFVNSTLNLNLDGKLTDDLFIRASITDQNVPFQPEGNTQQLQEFDNVFIQLYNDRFKLTGGDLRLTSTNGYFLKYLKNVQGGLLDVNYNLKDSLDASTAVGVSVAKGQFASIQLAVSEGVQGPYKIPGPNNEKVVIVLANSEKVFLDGRLLKRGFNEDYVIDYNLGEITFTNRVLNTRFSRVRIDYEYSDRDYSRSILVANHNQQLSQRVSTFLNFYQEKDSRNQPLVFDLSDADKLELSGFGDTVTGALAPGADSLGFVPNTLLYKKIDTLDLDGQSHTIFVFSQDPDSASFAVTFTEVGTGNGNYVLNTTTANGRVYSWLSPVGGVPQGNFESVRVLPAPNMKRLLTAGTSVKINPYERIFAEIGLSNNDLNLFSAIDDEDNKGYAIKAGIASAERIFWQNYKLEAGVDFEFNDKHFQAIDRFRYIEFDRDWSFDPNETTTRFDDNIYSAFFRLKQDDSNELGYKITGRKRGTAIEGLQHNADFAKQLGRLSVGSSYFGLKNEMNIGQSEWHRFRSEIGYKIGNFIPGYRYEIDRNKITAVQSDSVISSAMNFAAHSFFVKSVPSAENQLTFDYTFREDRLPFQGVLVDNTRSNTANLDLSTAIGEEHHLNLSLIYRNLQNLAQSTVGNEETISSRLDWLGTAFNQLLRTELTYSVSNGRELKREFVYLEVPVGEGTHTWRDLNDDDIQDLSEFFEAINPDERNYIKVFTPTSEFVTAFDNLLNYRLSVKFPVSWRNSGGLKGLLSRLSNNTNWNVNHKTTDNDLGARLAPFLAPIAEEDLISLRESLRTTFFYNRSNPKFGLNWGALVQNRKQFLTNGFDNRAITRYNFGVRSNLNRIYNLRLNSYQEKIRSASDFLEGRNYTIASYSLGPSLAWQPKKTLRFTANYIHTNKRNPDSEQGNEQAISNELILEIRANKVSKSNLNGRFRFITIDFSGEENSPIGYELLQALRPGSNLTWSLNFQRKLMAGLQMNLTYEGRKSPTLDVIHIGRVQVSALF